MKGLFGKLLIDELWSKREGLCFSGLIRNRSMMISQPSLSLVKTCFDFMVNCGITR